VAENQSNPDSPEVGQTDETGPQKPKNQRKKPSERAAGAGQKRKGAQAKADPPPQRPHVRPVRTKTRHWIMMLSFVLLVVLPMIWVGSYLYTRAADQYASTVGFTVRREEAPTATDVMSGLTALSSSTSSDSDILYEYIQSQEMVRLVNQKLDLREIYSRYHERDPYLTLNPDSSIEDLRDYWQRMVLISYTQGTGLIELTVKAFDPEDAQEIAQVIFDESSRMINKLSAIAQDDAMKYARSELDSAIEQLKDTRQAIIEYRSRTQIVDPSADIQLQMGLLKTLQQQLGEELINLDLLQENTSEGDPRLKQAQQRLVAIRERIRQERQKFGVGGNASAGQDYATLVSEFERLNVEREFAEQKFTNALSNFDSAQAEAQRQSRYLAAYVQPTLAESAEFPRRALILGVVGLFLVIGWAILMLIYYSLRDRR
jgi:capsular polysaccharide transport system permease protein